MRNLPKNIKKHEKFKHKICNAKHNEAASKLHFVSITRGIIQLLEKDCTRVIKLLVSNIYAPPIKKRCEKNDVPIGSPKNGGLQPQCLSRSSVSTVRCHMSRMY